MNDGVSKILCDYINPVILKYKESGLSQYEKSLLKDCIEALRLLGFEELYLQYNKRFKTIENSKITEYKIYKNNVFIKSFKTRKEALIFYRDLLPFTGPDEKLEIIEAEHNQK